MHPTVWEHTNIVRPAAEKALTTIRESSDQPSSPTQDEGEELPDHVRDRALSQGSSATIAHSAPTRRGWMSVSADVAKPVLAFVANGVSLLLGLVVILNFAGCTLFLAVVPAMEISFDEGGSLVFIEIIFFWVCQFLVLILLQKLIAHLGHAPWLLLFIVRKLYGALSVNIWTLKHRSSAVRSTAAESLGRLKDPRAVAPLIGAIGDSDSTVCWKAARALREFKLTDSRAVDVLIGALQDDDEFVRWDAAKALGKLGEATDGVFLSGTTEPQREKPRLSCRSIENVLIFERGGIARCVTIKKLRIYTLRGHNLRFFDRLKT